MCADPTDIKYKRVPKDWIRACKGPVTLSQIDLVPLDELLSE
jgi:hypothetical protein